MPKKTNRIFNTNTHGLEVFVEMITLQVSDGTSSWQLGDTTLYDVMCPSKNLK